MVIAHFFFCNVNAESGDNSITFNPAFFNEFISQDSLAEI